jgi:hypothetical protein
MANNILTTGRRINFSANIEARENGSRRYFWRKDMMGRRMNFSRNIFSTIFSRFDICGEFYPPSHRQYAIGLRYWF